MPKKDDNLSPDNNDATTASNNGSNETNNPSPISKIKWEQVSPNVWVTSIAKGMVNVRVDMVEAKVSVGVEQIPKPIPLWRIVIGRRDYSASRKKYWDTAEKAKAAAEVLIHKLGVILLETQGTVSGERSAGGVMRIALPAKPTPQ